MEAEPLEADALLKGLESRIEAICDSGALPNEEASFQNRMKNVLESKEFSDLLELVEVCIIIFFSFDWLYISFFSFFFFVFILSVFGIF